MARWQVGVVAVGVMALATAMPGAASAKATLASTTGSTGGVDSSSVVRHGGFLEPVPCAITAATPPADATNPGPMRADCTATSTWTGDFTGQTIGRNWGYIQANGDANGDADETFQDANDPANTLRTLYHFTVTNGVFRAVGRVVAGTGAWAGTDGCSVFTGQFPGSASGYGGYTVDWNLHPSDKDFRDDAALIAANDANHVLLADHDPCTVTTV